MIQCLLPRTHKNTYQHLNPLLGDQIHNTYSNSLSFFLSDIKKRIDLYNKEWDNYKKYTNPYEYIHTVIPNKKKSVASVKPLSRSYFKMIEMLDTHAFDFGPQPINTFHLAEGPGGFIEALAFKRANPADHYIGMTILDDNDHNVPAWKKSQHFLNTHSNVSVETGATQTGDILSLANLRHCAEKYGSTMDFVTGDGGFDFSDDYNNQEHSIVVLLFAQIMFALVLQKQGGSFILKIFDSFMEHTVDLLYLLSSFYEEVRIVKPRTSRYANSEKYVICRGFLFDSVKMAQCSPILINVFSKLLDKKRDCKKDGEEEEVKEEHVVRFLDIPIPLSFIQKVEEYNTMFGQQQIENIHQTISLIEQSSRAALDTLIRNNIQLCVQWCQQYGVEYQEINRPLNNIFLSSVGEQG